MSNKKSYIISNFLLFYYYKLEIIDKIFYFTKNYIIFFLYFNRFVIPRSYIKVM